MRVLRFDAIQITLLCTPPPPSSEKKDQNAILNLFAYAVNKYTWLIRLMFQNENNENSSVKYIHGARKNVGEKGHGICQPKTENE